MEILIFVLLGVVVALDVCGFTLTQLQKFHYDTETGEREESPIRWGILHGGWHAAILGFSLGAVELIAGALKHYLLPWTRPLVEWFRDALPWAWAKNFAHWLLEIMPTAPLHIFAGLAIVLFIKLYWDKMEGAATGEEPKIPWAMSWVYRFGERHVSAVLVALDMWFLSPLLKTLLEGYSAGEKVLAVGLLFVTVALVSGFVAWYGARKTFGSASKTTSEGMAFWLILMCFAEPLSAGYFAVRAFFFTFIGQVSKNPMVGFSVFMAISFLFVALLVHIHGYTKIVMKKHDEAREFFAEQGLPTS